ncbi:hypothetical protein NPIL_638971, partial [Nephila pilipes]
MLARFPRSVLNSSQSVSYVGLLGCILKAFQVSSPRCSSLEPSPHAQRPLLSVPSSATFPYPPTLGHSDFPVSS